MRQRKRTGFAERLKAARILRGYNSATAFAKEIGMEVETYSTYERGIREPKLEHLRRIADRLRVSIDELIPPPPEIPPPDVKIDGKDRHRRRH